MTTETTSANRVRDLRTLEFKLVQIRDELRVKMHLAQADARDEWDRLEQKWVHFSARAHDLREAASEAGDDLWDGLKTLGREIEKGYEGIRKAL